MESGGCLFGAQLAPNWEAVPRLARSARRGGKKEKGIRKRRVESAACSSRAFIISSRHYLAQSYQNRSLQSKPNHPMTINGYAENSYCSVSPASLATTFIEAPVHLAANESAIEKTKAPGCPGLLKNELKMVMKRRFFLQAQTESVKKSRRTLC